MDAQAFWNVIGNYNQQTKNVQIILFMILILGIALSYTQKVKWSAKFVLGIVNLFIGIAFFSYYGTEPIQKFFALPLFLVCGILFLYECYHSRDDRLEKPNLWQVSLLALYLLYPLISVMLGNNYPQMVTHIMPCPVVSLGIVIYSGYKRKNKALLTLLTVWGLTGIKSVIFNAYEDIILLVCGLYGIILLINEIRQCHPSLYSR
ncbi:hypothetical protein B5F53_17785 [Blautia sp. An249]|uniref:DUF6064 family protein n=1 Tax=Blautia sp. An249 TaxID=1965603 RepID=UPI000B39258C|nr:DUF6064 family protein [Blautia sp. An249]OUO76020.1 hypothetical protein B5F53_17785 [Blautia sp. An249]